MEITYEINKMVSYDIVVVGFGVAGAAAALAARRQGKKVLIIEKLMVPGGLATSGAVNFFVPMCNGRGKQIIRGMAEEFLRLSIQDGYHTLPKEWENGEPKVPTSKRYMTFFSAPLFSMGLTELLSKEGADIMFDTLVTDVIYEKDKVTGVVADNKSGKTIYSAKQFIDTTGDAEIMKRCGIPCMDGKNYDTFYAMEIDQNSVRTSFEDGNLKRLIHYHFTATSDYLGNGHPNQKPLWNGCDGEEISRYCTEKHVEYLHKLREEDKKLGRTKEQRDCIFIPFMPQFREIRHIIGEDIFREENAYQFKADSIGLICDFDKPDLVYEVPFKTLYHRMFSNIITAGRSASADGRGWDVLRVIPPAILTGEAAGLAAAQAIDEDCAIALIDVKRLQDSLREHGVLIHLQDIDDGL